LAVASKVSACIERERKKRDWDYRDLAKHLGVSLSQAHDWATGKYNPRLSNIRRIAKRLGLEVSELIS
jgi:transcriptional regulator with XRE-family HTH domain